MRLQGAAAACIYPTPFLTQVAYIHARVPLLLCPPLLQLITLDSVPVEVRQAAAVNFKNFVKYHWAPREGDGLGAVPFAIPDPEKVGREGVVGGWGGVVGRVAHLN